MHISEVEKYRKERDHQARHGHLSAKDRDETAYHRYGADKFDKNYHSPEDNFGGMHGVDPNSHGVENQ